MDKPLAECFEALLVFPTVEVPEIKYKSFQSGGSKVDWLHSGKVPILLNAQYCGFRNFGFWDMWIRWNMTDVSFRDCIFQKVRFLGSSMNKLAFNNCRFENECSFYGSAMKNVTFSGDCTIDPTTRLNGVRWEGRVSGLEDRLVLGGWRGRCLQEGEEYARQFILHRGENGKRYVEAGCRFMTVEDARIVWGGEHIRAHKGQNRLNTESLVLVDEMMRRADVRGWPEVRG